MAGAVNGAIIGDANLLNLKEISISGLRKEVAGFLKKDEAIIQAFQTV